MSVARREHSAGYITHCALAAHTPTQRVGVKHRLGFQPTQVSCATAPIENAEPLFAEDLLSGGVAGLSRLQMRQYLE